MRVINRRARYDYQLLDRLEAGVVLTGGEVKSIKEGRISLEGSFVKIINGEVFLLNAQIPAYKFADNRNYEPKRTRKLLLTKKQIISLESKMKGANLTIVATACYTSGRRGLIKVEVALARGKRKWDKRKTMRERDLEREMEKNLR